MSNNIAGEADIRSAALELERQADSSLDMRPEFRRAIANVHTALAAPDVEVQGAAPSGNPRNWLIDGCLIYRLNDDGVNCDEINVTMVHGSYGALKREAFAASLLNVICAADYSAVTAKIGPNGMIWTAITRLERQDSTYAERMAAADDLRLLTTALAAPVAGPTDPMPKRTAFIAWCKSRSLETDVDKDAWGAHIFKHSHIQAMWEGWFNAPSVSVSVPAEQRFSMQMAHVMPPFAAPASQRDADREVVIGVLSTHRLVHMYEAEDDGSLGNSYPLIDHLCLEGGRDIQSGKDEVEAIADAILDALDDQLQASRFRVQGGNTSGESSERAPAYCPACELNVFGSCGSLGCSVAEVGSIGDDPGFLIALSKYNIGDFKASDLVAYITNFFASKAAGKPDEAEGCESCLHTYCLLNEKCRTCGHVAESQGWKGGKPVAAIESATQPTQQKEI